MQPLNTLKINNVMIQLNVAPNMDSILNWGSFTFHIHKMLNGALVIYLRQLSGLPTLIDFLHNFTI